MVLLGEELVDRDRHLREVELHAAQRHLALAQAVLVIELAQIEGVIGGRQPGRIRVPEEKVEREGLLAEKIIVHDVRPDQVAWPEHVEHRRHARAVEIALLRHHLFQRLELRVVDEDEKIARLAEVDLRREEARRGDAVVALRRHIGERAREQRAADAIAEHVHVVEAELSVDGLDGRENALMHIVFEGLLGVGRIRVDPRDHEHREALIDRELDEGFLRHEIEDVVLVDPWRHDDERPLVNLLGRRRVLDELDEIVLEDDLARRDGEIAPDLEGAEIRLADAQQILRLLKVVREMRHALHEILRIGRKRRADDLGIGEGIV